MLYFQRFQTSTPRSTLVNSCQIFSCQVDISSIRPPISSLIAGNVGLLLNKLFTVHYLLTTLNPCLNCFSNKCGEVRGKFRERKRQGDANQNGLQLIRGTSGLVHEHLLGDILPPLHTVQLVIGVTVQHWPAEELCQGLVQTTRSRKHEKKEAGSTELWPRITLIYIKLL